MLDNRMSKTPAGIQAVARARALLASQSSSGAVNAVLLDNMLLNAIACTVIHSRMGYAAAARYCVAFSIDAELYKMVYNHAVQEKAAAVTKALMIAEQLTRERHANMYGV